MAARRSVFNGCLIHEHHWNVILDVVDTTASVAAERGSVLDQTDRRLTFRTNEDLEQRGINWHVRNIAANVPEL